MSDGRKPLPPFAGGTKAGGRTVGTQGLGSPSEKRDPAPRRKCDLCRPRAEGRRKHCFPFPAPFEMVQCPLGWTQPGVS